jgi:hypothetical protein
LFSYLLSLCICHYSFTPTIILFGILYLMNTHTSDGQHKNYVTTNNAENNGGNNNNQDANPLPPPPPTLQQVLAMQAQMLQTMQQTMVNLHAQPQAPPSPRDRLGDFQRTKPPTFSRTVQPMDADD